MDLYELVDAEGFVGYLKTSKLSELQERADTIKERVQFLLFERELVYIGYAIEPGFPSNRDGNNMEVSALRSPGGIGARLFRLAPDVLTSTAKTIKWRSHINKLLRDAEASLVNERARTETVSLAKRTHFQSEIEEFDGEVKGFAKEGDLRHAATYVVQLAKTKDTLFSFRKTVEAIIEEETKLQWKMTDFGKLDDIAEEMEPCEQLWKIARKFREMSSRWLCGSLFELDASEGMQALHQMLTIIANVSKILHLNSADAAIAAEVLKKQLTDFRENARLVGAISDPSMKDRYLKEVSALLGLSLDPQDPLTLLKLLESGALVHLGEILEISQNATQEKQIEDALVEIDAEWRDVQFLFKTAKKPKYGSSNLPVPAELKKPGKAPDHLSLEVSTLLQREFVEDVTQLVEEHQVRLQSLLLRRVAELSAKEKPSRCDANVALTQPLGVQSVTARPSDALDSHDVEKMEHKVVCIALREELIATTPAANMDLIEFLLRDFAANPLTREIRITKSFLLTPGQTSLGLMPSTLSDEQSNSKSQLEDAIEGIVRAKEPVWMAFGLGFSQKIVQLLQHMKANRAVVISGGVQSGKTALCKALARSISELCSDQTDGSARDILRGSTAEACSNELIGRTRCVVLAPRAVTVDNLLGTSADQFENTLLAHIIREAKSFHEEGSKMNTWLVLDGDLDPAWSEKLLYLIEELQDDFAGHQKGLLLSSGKYVLLPRCMRLVVETITLANLSPSFLARVSVVNVGQAVQREWRGLYRAWKKAHELEFDAPAGEIWGVVDVLVEETVDACLGFVESNFQRGFSQLRLARLKSLLALFHSSIRQSWPKFRSMVSGKQRKTAFHCFYLQALVWGIGNTCDAHERRIFHEFLRHLVIHGPYNAQSSLKRVLILFFPSGTTGTGHISSGDSAQGGGMSLPSQGAHRSQSDSAMKDSIYAFGFSVDYGLKWMRWTEYYELWLQAQTSVSTSSSSGPKGMNELNEDVTASLTDLILPNGSQAAAICMVNQLMLAQCPTLLKGLRDSGKSVCGSAWLALNSAFSNAQAAAEASLQVGSGNASEVTNSQHVYVGLHTSAADVLEQVAMFLKKPHRKKKDKLSPSESNAARNPQQQIRHDKSASVEVERRMSYVFIDDLHCLDPGRKMDSAVELLRVLTEHRQAIHPTSNLVTACLNILPLASIQANIAFNASQHHDTTRLLNRFVPVTLPALTDAELSSICVAIVSPNDSGLAFTPSGADVTVRDSHKAYQLLAIVVKCSIKPFRFMSGEFSQHAARVSFDPSKLQYVFHVHDVFAIVRSVCCDGNPALTLAEKPHLARLWCHESARTLGDRLIEPKETTIFYQHVRDLALHSFGLAPEVFFLPYADLPIGKTSDTSHLWLANHIHICRRKQWYRHVLRLIRLLRHEGRNVLLIGTKGSKMATVARLAAFICRKTAILYSTSTSSASQNSEPLVGWKHELRNAVLASVYKKDENVVFIFKDSQLLGTGHYDAIERFVTGAQFSSDILAYEDLDDHLLSILRDQMRQEQEENRTNKLATQTILSTKAPVLEYFYTQVRKKFQMVAILSDPQTNLLSRNNENLGSRNARSRLVRLLWQIPRLLKHCTVDCFGEWPEESLSAIAHKCFALSSEIEKERAVQFAQAAVQIYQSTRRFYDRVLESPVSTKEGKGSANELLGDVDEDDSSSPQLPSLDRPPPIQLDSSMLIAQICLFLKFLGRLSREITGNKSKYHMGLTFLEQTEQMLVAEQAQAEVLQPEMQKRADFTRRMSGTLEKEKITSIKLNHALDLATSLVEAQRGRLANVEAGYQELVKDSMVVFKQAQTNISVFQIAKSEESDEEQGTVDSPVSAQDNNATAINADNNTESGYTSVDSVQESVNGQEGLQPKGEEASVVEPLSDGELKERELKQHRRALIRSFAPFKPVPTALKQLAEYLGLIFGFQPVEARDELDPDEVFMGYWEGMSARLKTKAFWDGLIVFDVEARVNDKILGQVLPICISPDFEKEMFVSIHGTTSHSPNKLQVLNSQAASEESLWNEIDTAAKKQNTLMVTDFCEESAFTLRSLIGAKRRALFEIVNRDISSISAAITGNGNTSMPRLGDGSDAVNYPCWFQIPQSAKQHDGSTTLQQQTQKAGVHTQGVRSVCRAPHSEASRGASTLCTRNRIGARMDASIRKPTQDLADAYGEQHLLTEIQTLQLDIMSYQEQIDAIENEILDFFSAKQSQDVYSEVSKVLRIVGNRSAMHTLESSKTESESKIRSNRTQLDRFAVLVHRGVDFAYAWRDIAWVTNEMQLLANGRCGGGSDSWFVLPWVWNLLAKSLQQYEPRKPLEEMTRIYTESAREFVAAGLRDDEQLLFDFLLSLRLHNRRRRGQHYSSTTSNIVVENKLGSDKVLYSFVSKSNDSLFLHGLRLMGQLQLQVVRPRAPSPPSPSERTAAGKSVVSDPASRQSPELHPEGIAVVLEVTIACMATSTTPSSAAKPSPLTRFPTLNELRRASSKQLLLQAPQEKPLATLVECLCPIYHSDAALGFPKHPETSLCVMTALPEAELCFSGSSLVIHTFKSK
ncbi:Dynein heavy chain, partial [Globisporangium splendens]